jgi:ribosomal protein S12 methylthiotransferase accessory factor
MANSDRRLLDAVSPYTGILHSCELVPVRARAGEIVVAQANLAAVEPVLGLPERSGAYRGAGGRLRGAMRSALGEAIERYAMSWLPSDQLVHASAYELGSLAADPDEFILFDDRQYLTPAFPFARFGGARRIDWVRGFRVRDRSPAYIPLDKLCVARPWVSPRLDYVTTSGMASRPTIDQALIRGLLEVLERDAFMISWYSRLSLPIIEWDLEEPLALADHRWLPPGASARLLDLSAFHELPTVVAVTRAASPDPIRFTLGAGCDLTIEDACVRALSEACSARSWLHTESFIVPSGPDAITDVQHHAQYYADPDRVPALDFIDASPELRRASEISGVPEGSDEEVLAALVERVERAGSTCYAVDMTPPDVQENQLSVVQVVCPGLQPLDASYWARHLDGRRLFTAASNAGLRATPLQWDDLSPDPHPFP